jgi:ABC-2 type transport system ATP-binding protein
MENSIENSIETNQLNFSFGKKQVLQNLNLSIPKGSIYGFLGPNGAGKTTTIRILLGLIELRQADVKIFGLDIRKHRLSILRRIGALVEMPSLYEHLSGRKNLEITRLLYGNIPASRIDEVLEIVGLTKDAHRPTKQYSLGMKQRLGLAVSLLANPELLVLDEPTNGLDPNGIKEVRELLIQLNRDFGKTVFVSSHLLAEVERTATHVGIVHQGRLHFQGTIQDLHARQQPLTGFETSQNDKALPILQEKWQAAHLNGQGMVYIPTHDKAEIHYINELLLRNQIEVYRIQPLQSSLEDLFMKITEN